MRRQRGQENRLIRGRMNLSAFHESLTKLLAHEELAVEMVMLNCNKRKQKYKVSRIKGKLYGCHSYVLRSLFPPR